MATVTRLADTMIVGENDEQLVTMVVDNQLFGIPILQVQDIVEASKITPVPLAPSAIAGVLNLRGRIVTVIDLRKLMGNHDEVPWESQMGVTVEHKGDLYTLLVDAIGDVRTLARRDFDKAPSTIEPEVKRLCSGIYRLRGNLLVVLDVGRILKSDVISATPMLTVEDRKKRKAIAMQESGGDVRARQLSTLMNDLRAYEAETAQARLAGNGVAADDMKSRKRATRARRPAAERWQEALAERDRLHGKVVYRMREPDEETLEEVRRLEHEAGDAPGSAEDMLWQSRIRSAGDADTSDDELTALTDDPFDADPPSAGGDGMPQESPAGDDAPAATPGWWSRLRGKETDEPQAPADGLHDPVETVQQPADEAGTMADEDSAAGEIEDWPPADGPALSVGADSAGGDDEPKTRKTAAKSGKAAKSSKSPRK